MTSLSKDPIESIQPSFSAENIGGSVPPSKPLVSTESTLPSIQPMPKQSKDTLPADNTASTTLTTPATTPKITERSRQHADIAKAALSQLLKAGLIKQFNVLSKNENGTTTLKEIRVVFDPSLWTEGLDLK